MCPANLLATGVTVRRGRRSILHDESFEFKAGITAVLGPNGAGKSTLLDLLATGNYRRTQLFQLGDGVINSRNSRRQFLRESGYLPQDWSSFDQFTVRESIEYTAWLKELSPRQCSSSAADALSQVDLTEKANEKVGSLSGGMKQRLGLAEAIVNDPKLLILDEPTVGLDPQQRRQFRSILSNLDPSRVTILSTHLLDDVLAIADRVLVINHGNAVFSGSLSDLANIASPGKPDINSIESAFDSLIQHSSNS